MPFAVVGVMIGLVTTNTPMGVMARFWGVLITYGYRVVNNGIVTDCGLHHTSAASVAWAYTMPWLRRPRPSAPDPDDDPCDGAGYDPPWPWVRVSVRRCGTRWVCRWHGVCRSRRSSRILIPTLYVVRRTVRTAERRRNLKCSNSNESDICSVQPVDIRRGAQYNEWYADARLYGLGEELMGWAAPRVGPHLGNHAWPTMNSR